MTTPTPLVDVLLASLRMETCNDCRALESLFSLCQAVPLEERIRQACTKVQSGSIPDHNVTEHLALLFRYAWDGADEKVQHAIHRLLLNRSSALDGIFEDIVYPMFEDPSADVAINLR